MSVSKPRRLRRVVSGAIVVGGLAATTAAAVAITGPGDPLLCRGDARGGPSQPVTLENRMQYLLVDFDSVVSGLVSSRTYPLTAPLAAGTYTVNAVSWDGYEGRGSIPDPQPAERWYAQLLDASGAVLATTTSTPDVADDADEVLWSGALGEVSWAAGTATSIRVVHAMPGAPTPNSVVPVCVSFVGVGVKPNVVTGSTTTVPATTVPPTTSVGSQIVTPTTVPTTVPADSQGPTTSAPGQPGVGGAGVTPPSPPVEPIVEPQVEVKGIQVTNVGPAQTANPITAQPTFTG
jgi:hypothetical protein